VKLIFNGKAEGKRPHGRPTCSREDNIRMDFRKMRKEVVDLMHLPQDRYQWRTPVNTVMNLGVP
jgi:hypothetical protein